ncbi:hypothetical protein [Asanoa iriomotensis]|uniref:SUKH-4 immunity protein of toxin-antitoxin system n=1 Tax=Asanoa iriomotensis TaxID=234613 RepID=A0ABQ4C7X6_9ACTN|nr:hypothetical protein [Asanoa iriomotensis]GIF58556.1 hypothetical protein Air01nite_46510 [Asanoa iriomotensis]
MSDRELLEHIRATPWIAQALAEFDFDLSRVDNGPAEEVHLASGERLEMIAGDAAGGAFMLAGDGADRPVVYVGSEGEGGLIATTLRDALALIVGLSSIHDATAHPLGDDGGAKLRAWLAEADDEIRADWPDLDAARQRLRTELRLPAGTDLLADLHAAAADDRYRPISDAGDAYEAMVH